MTHQPAMRALTIAALVAALATGCARAPLGTQAAPLKRTSTIGAMAAPVSGDALSVARKWQANAVQVGVSIIRMDETDDIATYLYTAPGKTDAMLIVAATQQGLKAQEVPLTGQAADGIAKMAPLSGLEVKLLDSKDLFKKAQAAGLVAPQDLVVLHAKDHAQNVPVALVTGEGGQSFLMLDASTGKALSAVSRGGDRRVQAHQIALAVVIVGAVGTAVIWGAKKLIQKFWKPKTKPSPTPTPAPTAAPSDAPAETPAPVLSAPPAGL